MEEEVKVSELPVATNVDDEDLIMVVQGGFNKKVSKENLLKETENEIEKMTTYSTEETKVGTWINGQTLYRKVIEVGQANVIAQNQYTNLNFSTSNYKIQKVEFICKATAIILPSNSYDKTGDRWMYTQLGVVGTDYVIYYKTNITLSDLYKVYAILEYTKI